jgi:hypothetical protein
MSFLKPDRIDPPKCNRWYSGKRAQYEVSSDIIHIKVCFECAEEAQRIGLAVKPTIRRFARAETLIFSS